MSELERALLDLGPRLDVPETPDLASEIRARLQARPAARAPRPRWGLAVALAAVAALLATLAIPDARSSLLRVLRLGGTQIERVDELPPVPSASLEFFLGERVTLEQARRRAGFELRELEDPADHAYLGQRGTVWLLYGDVERPRLLIAQTPRHSLDDAFLLKKLVDAGTRVETVTVHGVPAYLLSGEPHVVALLDERGRPVEESARLARDVLVWEEGGVAYRLEGDFSAGTAVEIAESLR